MFTTLLVGLDGSPRSEVALAQAILVGQRFRSTLLLAHVTPAERRQEALVQSLGPPWREGRPTPLPDPVRGLEEAGQRLLEDAAGAVERAGLRAETSYRSGDVAAELSLLAEQADVAFVGRVGRGSRGEDPLGPDVRRLIRRAPAPIVVCASTVTAMDRCAVAYDGESTSVLALSLAARYAEVSGAQLEVINAGEPGAEDHGREVLARASMALSATPLQFETHFEAGKIAEAVARAVQRLGCNALFAGGQRAGHGPDVPSHIEAILRATDIPVLVHHEPQNLSARASGTHRRPPS
jgi:nucleotide-binding universal stress UspA family protein